MGETQNLQEQDRRNFHHLIANFSFLDLVPLRHKCPEKYKASTTNVPVCAEFVLETKMSHHILNRTRCLQVVKFSIWMKYVDKANSYSTKPILSSSIYLHVIQIKYIFIFAICEPDKGWF